MEDKANDKAGIGYWNDVWEDGLLPVPVDPQLPGRQNRVNRAFHQFFKKQFSSLTGSTASLVEVGAARSQWLPYFSTQFGFSVTGLDYSPTGCDQARRILERAGVHGNIVEADLFDPPLHLQNAFDVVVSFGVVEHFADTSSCVRALSKLLKPGGLMITEIPNLAGPGRVLEKKLCPDILAVHNILSARDLRLAHIEAGLQVQSCNYVINGGFSNLNVSCRRGNWAFPVIARLPMLLTSPFILMDYLRIPMPPNRLTSPYIICVARDSRQNL